MCFISQTQYIQCVVRICHINHKKKTLSSKKYSLFISLFWKVTDLKPLQWCRISLTSIPIPHQLKPKQLLLTWLKQLWSVWPWLSLISKAVRWCWNYICDVCIQWGRSGGGKVMEAKLWLCSFLPRFFPDSCCWIKPLSQQEHGVLLTTTWHWGRLDNKMIGTRQKNFGVVSALFCHHCQLGVLFGVMFTLFGFDPRWKLSQTGWVYFSLSRQGRGGLTVWLVKPSANHSQSR